MRLGQSVAFQRPLVVRVRKSELMFSSEVLKFLGVSVDQRRTLVLEPFPSSRDGQRVLGLQLRYTAGMGLGKVAQRQPRSPVGLGCG